VEKFVFLGFLNGNGTTTRYAADGENSVRYRALSVLGATPEQAEQRAKALLTILDQGFSRPSQIALFKLREQACEQFRDSQQKAEAAEKEHQSMVAELKQYADFPNDTLTGLRVQLFQWEAELAGLQAKVEACDKLLAAGPAAERRKQIEEAKVAAQIELAGCEARRAKSASFIAKVKQREEVASKTNAASGSLASAQRAQSQITARIKRIDEELATFAPVHLVDDTVIIQPVEWTKNQ
jgi:hypothetical protein